MRSLPLLLILLLPAGAAQAQAPAAPPKPAVTNSFAKLFPKPTGKNGYEELVLAGDLVANNRDFGLVDAGGTPLSFQRQVVQETPIQQALTLVRRGLAKGSFSPREELHMDTLLPELSGFRRLARLLKVVIHVQMADGRTGEAIETARLGLRLAKASDTDTLISSLVAAAMNAILVNEIGSHLDQLSARDSEALFRLCVEWLQQPDPAIHALQVERRNIATVINDFKHQAPDEVVKNLGLNQDNQAAVAEIRRIYAQPDTVAQVFDQAGQRLDRLYAESLQELLKPAWLRKWPEGPSPSDSAETLFDLLKPSISALSTAFTRDQARIRLLACHAAIIRYRWEHDRLPETIEELRLGDLIVDPFTGQRLKYEPGIRYYRLSSAGAPAAADNPRAVEGRLPVSIVPGE